MTNNFEEDPEVQEVLDLVKSRWKTAFWAVDKIINADNLPSNEQIPVVLYKYCRILEVDKLVKEGILKSEDELLDVVSAKFPDEDLNEFIQERDKRMKWKEEHFDYSDNPTHYECREEKMKNE